MKLIKEAKRLQQLAGINEIIKINSPLSIKIKPTNSISGIIRYGDGDYSEYNIVRHGDEAGNVIIEPPFEAVNDLIEYDGDEDYYPEEETKIVCERLLDNFKKLFGENVRIVEDEYSCSEFLVPLKNFNRILNSSVTTKPTKIDDNVFTFEGNTIKLKKLTPDEIQNYRNELVKASHEKYPHMNYDKNSEDLIKYSEVRDEVIPYFILNDKNVPFKSAKFPQLNDIFSIPNDSTTDDSNNVLNLIRQFRYHYGKSR